MAFKGIYNTPPIMKKMPGGQGGKSAPVRGDVRHLYGAMQRRLTGGSKTTMFKKAKNSYSGLQLGENKGSPVRTKTGQYR
jgi:hypothetical protein